MKLSLRTILLFTFAAFLGLAQNELAQNEPAQISSKLARYKVEPGPGHHDRVAHFGGKLRRNLDLLAIFGES